MKLFEIAQEELDLMNELMENDGELTPELEQRLTINADNMSQKMEGYCKAIGWYNVQIDGAKAEIERLRRLVKRSENSISWMEDAMLNVMTATQKQKVSAGTFTVGTRRSTAVDVFDEAALPDRFRNVIETVKIDKLAIKDALKSGEMVAGAQMIERKSISIK